MVSEFMPFADYALGWQDLFGSTINVDGFFLHQSLNLVIAYALNNNLTLCFLCVADMGKFY